MYEVIILGGGPAGMTAGVYCARKRLKTLVITPEFGGQAMWSAAIENYLGYQYVTGPELIAKFQEHLKTFEIETEEDKAVSLKKLNQYFEVETEGGKKFQSKAVIVATGKSPRKLGVPGEDKLYGRGVTHCAICDAPLFKGMDVAVVGGGNSAMDAALQLSKYCPNVYLVSLGPLEGDAILKSKIESETKITSYIGFKTVEIKGEKFVEEIVVENLESREKKSIPVKGVFVEVGSIPNSQLVEGLAELNEKKEIKVNCRCETSVPGLFAAGDVTDVPEKQIIIAAGEGAKAALSASSFILAQKD
jgi:alkyl hydroperoxide reductase subunit F